ncbi:MAG: hypothetical protein JXQ96_23375 [Cyclobacteriaceae bacterium]
MMKKKFKDTKIGKLLSKVAPSIIETVGDVFPPVNILSNLISKDASINEVDRLEAIQMLNDYEIEVFNLEVEDRKSAREDGDKSLQKILAYFSLIGFSLFLLATMIMSYQILVNQLKINEFVIMTVSNGNGVFTALLFTLKDFLYGGSLENK